MDTAQLIGQMAQQQDFEKRKEANKPLKQRLAEARERARYEQAMAYDAQQTEELLAGADPTIGMSTGEKLGAGFQSGLRRVGRGVGNMVGLVDDEAVAEAKRLEAPLGETGAGAVGQFAGEMAALAPLSLPSAGTAGAVKAVGAAKSLPAAWRAARAANVAGNTGRGVAGLSRAAAESGAAGAILADPGERGDAALSGAATGAALNRTMGALSRKFGKGFDESDAAKKFNEVVGKELGRAPSLPVAQSAKSNIVKYPHKSVLSMFPTARGGSHKMAENAHKDWSEAVLRRSFKKDLADEAAKIYRETGDFVKAFNYADDIAGKSPYLGVNRRVLRDLTQSMRAGEPLTPKHLDRVSQRVSPNKGESRAFYDLISSGEEVLGEAIEESTVSGRRAYNKIMNAAVTGLGASVTGVLPYAGLVGATRTATSAPMQNFMMGRTGANRGITKAAESLYADALRNAIAGQE
jgi:hypothetical protein